MTGCLQTRERPGSAERQRWVFSYSVDGDLRFISHRDTLRLLERALARALLPVRYSEGFNPHPRVSIPLPRPVGIASQAESIVVEFEGPIDGEAALRKLQRQMPADIRMVGARRLQPGERLDPTLVRYRLDPGGTPVTDMGERLRELMESTIIPLERVNPKNGQARTIDVRPYLVDLHVDGDAVEFTLRVTGDGTVKPAEIAGLLGFDPGAINHRVRRLEVQWS